MSTKKRLLGVFALLFIAPVATMLLLGQGYPLRSALALVFNGTSWVTWTAVGTGGPPGFALDSIRLYCQSGSSIGPCAPSTTTGTVSSITSTGSTITVTSGTGPTANVEINLGHANTWTANQTFGTPTSFSDNVTIAVGKSLNTPILRDNAGNAVFTASAGVATFSNRITTAATGIANVATQTSVAGTAGTALFSEPEQGTSYKHVVIYLNGLTGSAAYTYPAAFSHVPNVGFGAQTTPTPLTNSNISAISATAITVTGTTATGFIILDGF